MSIWNTAGPDQDVVLSSRVRLARNFTDVPFPSAMSEQEAFMVMDKTTHLFRDAPFSFRYQEMRSTDEQDRILLLERHLISPEMVENGLYGAVLISQDELLCIMINEEDHLRIQSMMPGLDLKEAMKKARQLDEILEQSDMTARDDRFGYLTACLTNVGTGLRASVMMHLPAMTMTRQIDQMVGAVQRHGLTVRGLYGEKSQASGNLYQISNQVTLVRSGDEIATSVEKTVGQIMTREREARDILMEKNRLRMEDKLYRSIGTLKYARRISTREFMGLLSDLRLALATELIEGITHEKINEIMVTGQSAGLMKLAGRELDSQQRDIIRGNYIRSALVECVERK